ncbi:hypothetical protein FQR65_LT02472 [Abscondita terminalis]|nr:hypothetical protein FQR65_LT02472 [Abscondita terminalis]
MGNRKYFPFILCLCFVIGIVGFVFMIIHLNGSAEQDTKLYPFSSCSFNGTLIQTQRSIKNLTKCKNNFSTYKFQEENGYIILNNYVISTKRFGCEESVTYATHSDYRFLDNLEPLLNRWGGPISVAIHAPGFDFDKTLESIIYLRNCVDLVKELVTFHLYFLEQHSPNQIPHPDSISKRTFDCSLDPPFKDAKRHDMYVAINNLTYPINVGRNVARAMSETYFLIVSDIELYPSPDLIPNFLKLIAGCEHNIVPYKPAVFVLHIFEIKEHTPLPTNKSDLVNLLNSGLVIPFHENICSVCHTIPKFKEWKKTNQSESLQIFNIGKRTGTYYHWEPIYIGTNAEPKYDERLHWEGMKDKVVQGLELCLMNYTFLVLDNAFLIHKPGIKVLDAEKNKWRKPFIKANDKLIDSVIVPEIKKRHTNIKECQL